MDNLVVFLIVWIMWLMLDIFVASLWIYVEMFAKRIWLKVYVFLYTRFYIIRDSV